LHQKIQLGDWVTRGCSRTIAAQKNAKPLGSKLVVTNNAEGKFRVNVPFGSTGADTPMALSFFSITMVRDPPASTKSFFSDDGGLVKIGLNHWRLSIPHQNTKP
jgi:hypothetical protein